MLPLLEITIGLGSGIGASVIGIVLERVLRKYFPALVRNKKDTKDIDLKLAQAHTAMREAGEYMSSLQQGLEQQRQDLLTAETEYKKYKELAEAEKGKAEAFLQALQQTVSSGNKRERLWNLGISLVSNTVVFILGVIAADSVKNGWAAVWNALHG